MKKYSAATKRHTVFVVLILASVLFLTVGFFLRSWFSEQSVEGERLSQPGEINQVSAVSTASVSAQSGGVNIVDTTSIETPTEKNGTTQRVNNIAVRLENFRREKDRILIDVCFDLPDDSDWTMWNSFLQYGGKVYNWSEGEPIEIRKPPVDGKQMLLTFPAGGGVNETWVEAADGQKGYRCDTVYFDGIPLESNSTHYTFTIDALEAAPWEGQECTQAYLEKAQAVLDANKTGITVKCMKGENTSGLEVADKPTSMSMEDAQSILSSSDIYLGLNGIKGPWIFEFEIK